VTDATVHHRTCCLCDALCRLRIDLEDGRIRRIAGVPEDPFSRGHICPKALALQDLHEDPDRLHKPLRRRGGDWEEVSWEEALEEAAERLAAVRARHGSDAVGIFVGNPNVHHYGNLFALALFLPLLGTRARFSSQSLDNLPHAMAARHMFGHLLLLPVPDIDRADHVVVLGANPWVSNGGGMSSGHVRQRFEALRARGGRVVVLDPRRTETAAHADAWHALRPEGDAPLLLAMLQVVFAEGLTAPGPWRGWSRGLEALQAAAARFPPERVEAATGLSAATIRGLARDLAAARHGVIYARLGTCTQRFGGLCSWLVYALCTVLGRLDQPGGLMFAQPAVDLVAITDWEATRGSYVPAATRVSGLPAVGDELPTAAIAEEIETPGPGQVRALITLAGNPVLSAPNGPRLEAALGKLDFHVAIDPYLQETSRHAHLILPSTMPLEKDFYPLGISAITVRAVASYAPALFAPQGAREDWDLLTDLGARLAAREGRWAWRGLFATARRLGTRRVLDLLLGIGPYGWLRGGALDLATLEASPHTLDLGPLRSCLPGRLRTSDRQVQLAPERYVEDLARLEAVLEEPIPALVLIGRRDLRSANSWLHNSERLVKGRNRCTLLVHPDDAAARGLVDGGRARVSSRVGSVEVPVVVSDEVRPGVVSLPHGWGHGRGGRQRVAAAHAGVSANDLTDEGFVDRLTGTAAFNGLPVEVSLPVTLPTG
jgi:anaerobic selenocysteine-containing dehydrogenase